jgi:hypothetical protein
MVGLQASNDAVEKPKKIGDAASCREATVILLVTQKNATAMLYDRFREEIAEQLAIDVQC